MSKVNSLDLVESCLLQIYTCRKKILHRKVANASLQIEARKQQQQRLHQNAQTANDFHIDTNDEDEENEMLVKSIVASYPAPQPLSPKKPSSVQSSARPVSQTLNQSRVKMTIAELEALRKEFNVEATDVERKILSDANADVEGFVGYLLDKYLTNRLDLVEPSLEVGEMKQVIALRVEELACLEPPAVSTINSDTNANDTSVPAVNSSTQQQKSKNSKVIDVNDSAALKSKLRSMRQKGGGMHSKSAPSLATREADNVAALSSDEEDAKPEAIPSPLVQQGKQPSLKKPGSSGGKKVTFVFVDPADNNSTVTAPANKSNPWNENSATPEPNTVSSAVSGTFDEAAPPIRAFTPATSAKKAAQQEKLRIKEQYEKYMKSKATQQENSSEMHARESLTADIQSVLDSLRGNGAAS